MIQLRPDQLQLKADIYAEWQHVRNVLAVLPTGGGKSVIVSDIVNERNAAGAMQCVMAHRVELVGQLSMHVARRGIAHRLIAPKPVIAQVVQEHRNTFGGRSFINPDARCSVAGVDTLIARRAALAPWCAQVDDWTIDEAHHVLKRNKWGQAAALFPNARGLGVTASPSRADGMGLGSHHDGVFDAMVLGPNMRWLIDNGALCDYQIACPESDFTIDDDDLAPSGDWSPRKMREASQRSHIVGDTVQNYVRFAYAKRGICFATDVETSQEIAAKFNAVGIPTAAVSAETPSDVRAEYIRRFRDGRLWMLVNVDLFGEGFDVPAVEVVIMARPTASLAVYLQQFGRALRVLAGKPFGLVIDQVSNWKRHGFPDKDHAWTLDRRDKRAKRTPDPEEIPLTACRVCSRPYERFHTSCPHCGATPPLPDPGGRTLEMVDGDLVLLDAARLSEMRAAAVLPSPADVGNRAAHVAGEIAGKAAANRAIERIGAQERLKHAFAQWAAVQRAKGRDDRESDKRIFLALGTDKWSALAQPRADMERISAIVESWYGGTPYQPSEKKSVEQTLIEEAIERGDQGFRGGWIECAKVTLLGVQTIQHGYILKNMGYKARGKIDKNIDGKTQRKVVYSNHDKDLNDFWHSNNYVNDATIILQNAINQKLPGFCNGWIASDKAKKLTNLKTISLANTIISLGYVSRGKLVKTINGVKIRTSVYSNHNNSLSEFLEQSGYE